MPLANTQGVPADDTVQSPTIATTVDDQEVEIIRKC